MFSVFEGQCSFHRDERCLTPSHFRDSPERPVYRSKFIKFRWKSQENIHTHARKAFLLHKSKAFSIFVSYLWKRHRHI